MPNSQAMIGQAFAFYTMSLRLVRSLIPGLAVVAAVTSAAVLLRGVMGLAGVSPMMIGVALGALIGNLLKLPKIAGPGVTFAGKSLLRLAVALLGVQITLGQLVGQGALGLLGPFVIVFATFGFCLILGRWLGVGRDLTMLIGAGTSVCGAAAIAGVNGSVAAKDEEVAYAILTITLFGCLAMVAAPLLAPQIGLTSGDYGRWVGLSLHEVAQVVGAGFQLGEEAGQTAVIAKLSRVILLAPLILFILTLPGSRTSSRGRMPVLPWFVGAFLALCLGHSAGLVPHSLADLAIATTPVMMTAAMTAIGLSTNFRRLGAIGLRPLALAGAATLFIAGLALLWSGLLS